MSIPADFAGNVRVLNSVNAGWRLALRVVVFQIIATLATAAACYISGPRAALAALATLGWLGQPLTLFSLFGLLLITAIGVDYAILMREAVGGLAIILGQIEIKRRAAIRAAFNVDASAVLFDNPIYD